MSYEPIFSSGSLILVTGASGYIASYTIKELLDRGFSVRGTVRSTDKGEFLKNTVFKKYQDKFDYIIVEDIQKDGVFDDAVQGVQGVLHIASPLYRGNAADPWGLIIEPAKKGTVNILQAVHEFNKDIKRVVITSSFAATADDRKGPGAVFTEKDWNIPAIEDALREGKNIAPFRAYAASKTWAEQAAWEFIEREKPTYDLTTILPPLVCGPVLNPVEAIEGLNRANITLWGYLTGSKDYTAESASREPNLPVVDVRDVAIAHVEALLRPSAANLRINVSKDSSNYQAFLDAVHADPDLKRKFPNATWGTPGARSDKPRRGVDATLSEDVLGLEYRDVSETARDSAESLLALGKQFGWEGA